jgi:hypothetical protein
VLALKPLRGFAIVMNKACVEEAAHRQRIAAEHERALSYLLWYHALVLFQICEMQ